MSTLTESEMKAFMDSIPAKYKATVARWYDTIVRKVTSRIKGKYSLDNSTAEDVSVAAATYSLAFFLKEGTCPETADDWMALANKKAKFLALDCCARAQRGPQLQLDEPQHRGDEDLQMESAAVGKWSYDTWRNRRQDEEVEARCTAVKEILGKIIEFMDVKDKKKTKDIFNAFYFEGHPMAEVGQRYGVTTNNGYQIVFRVKDAYLTYGKALVEEHLEHIDMAA